MRDYSHLYELEDGMDDLTVSLDRHFLLWFAEYGARCLTVLPNGQMVPTVDDTTRERMLAEYFERYIAPRSL